MKISSVRRSMNSEALFKTEDLPFAAFLACTRKLQFLRCEANGQRALFVFEDPENIGDRLYLDFKSGEMAPADSFYSCVKSLRQAMDEAMGRGRKERRHVEHRSNCGRKESNYL